MLNSAPLVPIRTRSEYALVLVLLYSIMYINIFDLLTISAYLRHLLVHCGTLKHYENLVILCIMPYGWKRSCRHIAGSKSWDQGIVPRPQISWWVQYSIMMLVKLLTSGKQDIEVGHMTRQSYATGDSVSLKIRSWLTNYESISIWGKLPAWNIIWK